MSRDDARELLRALARTGVSISTAAANELFEAADTDISPDYDFRRELEVSDRLRARREQRDNIDRERIARWLQARRVEGRQPAGGCALQGCC